MAHAADGPEVAARPVREGGAVTSFDLAGEDAGGWFPSTPELTQVSRAMQLLRDALLGTGPWLRKQDNVHKPANTLNEPLSAGMRGDGGPTSRTRRPHSNEGPGRHLPAPKPPAGRFGSGGRPGVPTQEHPGDHPGATVIHPRPAPEPDEATQPVALNPIQEQSGTGDGGTPPPQRHPARPDPTDAAAEVFALVERAQAGDAEAFGQIYDRYVDTVFRFIYFRVGNRQLAEDLTSDTFLRALKRIGSFTWQGRDLGAWLVTIARNLVADHFKSGRYRLEVTTGDVLDADREDRGPEGSPEAAVIDHITNVHLLGAVKQLNAEQQECIVLRFLQGFSVAETARAMGKNEGAIKALQYRAVRALARLLPDSFQM
jgi:RNA polymerase sigma-70 factor (ECF subfamily)